MKKSIVGKFTEAQIEQLRAAYGSIKRANPEGAAMVRLNKMVGSLDDKSLHLLIDARIPWVSSKALTEVTFRNHGTSFSK